MEEISGEAESWKPSRMVAFGTTSYTFSTESAANACPIQSPGCNFFKENEFREIFDNASITQIISYCLTLFVFIGVHNIGLEVKISNCG